MARFEIVVFGRTRRPADAPTERRIVLRGVGALLGRMLAALVAIGLVVTALVLGYVIAGLVIATVLVGILVVLVRSAWTAIRR